MTAFEATTTGVDVLSVTSSSKLHTPVRDKTPVEDAGKEEVVQANEEPRLP